MSIVHFSGVLSLASLLVSAGCVDALSISNNAVVHNQSLEEIDPVVTVCVVDCDDEAGIAGAILSTGAYNTIPDNVLGKTDGMGRWQGVLQCTYIWPDQSANAGGSVFAVTVSTTTDWLWITSDGYIPQRIDVSEFRKGNSADKSITVRATRGEVLRGRVTRTGAETPVGNEPILLIAAGQDYPMQCQTITDNSGGFEWNGFPGGEVTIALGIAGIGSEPFFQRYTPLDGKIVVNVSSNWQRRVPVGERHLLYVMHKDGIAILPAALEWLKFHGALDSMFSSPNEPSAHGKNPPVRNLVLSIPEKGDRFYFFALSGEHGDTRSSGEWHIGGDDVAENFQRMMNDRRSEHPGDPK